MKTMHEADTTPNMVSPTRNLNLGRILATVARSHPICGIESEGDAESGTTRLWAEKASNGKGVFFLDFENETLNAARLTEEDSTRLVEEALRRSVPDRRT